jgi:hypothetical protein
MLNIKISKKTLIAEMRLNQGLVRWRRGIRTATNLSGRAIQRRATTLLATGSRSGEHYRGQPHRSSAPGEYPRSQSGRLLRSIYYATSGFHSFRIGATEPHADFLERGTALMSARPTIKLPWMQKAMKLEERNITNYLRREVTKELRR